MKKNKDKQPWLKKAVNRVFLPAYLAFICVCGAAIIGAMAARASLYAVTVLSICLCVLIFAVSFADIFFIIPRMKMKQAMLDLKNFDFSERAIGGSESFECSHKMSFKLPADPFGYEEDATLHGGAALREYIPDSECVEVMNSCAVNDDGMTVTDMSPDNKYAIFRVHTEHLSDGTMQDVEEIYRVTFTRDGITAGGETFAYCDVYANFIAGFGRPVAECSFYAKVIFILNGELFITIRACSRIAGIIERYGIPVENGDVLAFIAADPERAFKKIAATINPRKQSLFTLK